MQYMSFLRNNLKQHLYNMDIPEIGVDAHTPDFCLAVVSVCSIEYFNIAPLRYILHLHPMLFSKCCPAFPGIMLLEKQLLAGGDSRSARPAKRARGASAPVSEATATWVELAR